MYKEHVYDLERAEKKRINNNVDEVDHKLNNELQEMEHSSASLHPSSQEPLERDDSPEYVNNNTCIPNKIHIV